MKKPIAIGLGVTLLLTVSSFSYYYFVHEDEKTTTKKEPTNIEAKVEAKAEEKTAPIGKKDVPKVEERLKRTVNIPKEYKYPFRAFPLDGSARLVKKGEQVWLFSDAEAYEEYSLGFVNADQYQFLDEKKANEITYFVKNLEKAYPEFKDYFDKMKEAAELVRKHDREGMAEKIKEAREIRERIAREKF